MKRYLVLTFALLSLFLFLAACRDRDDNAEQGEVDQAAVLPAEEDAAAGKGEEANTKFEPDENKEKESSQVKVDVTVQKDTVELILFFGDSAAAETGVEGEYGLVTPIRRQVAATEGILRLALEELIKGPKPGDGKVARTLPATTKILGIKINDGVATLDFSESMMTDHPGGSLGGIVTVQSLVFTACQFPTVDKVQVLVEGEPWTDYHFIWEVPLSPEDFIRS